MMATKGWQEAFLSTEATFHIKGEFDHSSAILIVYTDTIDGNRPCKYFIIWKLSP